SSRRGHGALTEPESVAVSRGPRCQLRWGPLQAQSGLSIRDEPATLPMPPMHALPADAPLNYAEHLLFERSVDSRHEFIGGDVLAMAGGTRRHAVLKSRLSARLTLGLGEGGPCGVEDSDTRIVVGRGAKLNAYCPDMVVICGEGETHPRDPDGGVVNPR